MISSHLSRSTFAHLLAPSFCLVLSALGAPPTPAKSFPLGQHRAWLGAALNLATLKDDLYFTLQPKESSVTQVFQGCHLAIARGSLTPAEASTHRGQAGWTAALSAGRFGRIGMHLHFESSTLVEDDVQALKFLAFWVSAPPLRAVFFGRSCRPPSRIYSDAAHTEGVRTRLGWVIPDCLSSEPWQLHAIALDPLQHRGVVQVGRFRFKPCGWPQQGWRSRLLDF